MTSSPQSRLFSNKAETALVVVKLATLSYTEAFARGLVDALTDSFNVTTMQAFGTPTAQAALESLKNTSKTPPRILSSLASHMLAHELSLEKKVKNHFSAFFSYIAISVFLRFSFAFSTGSFEQWFS